EQHTTLVGRQDRLDLRVAAEAAEQGRGVPRVLVRGLLLALLMPDLPDELDQDPGGEPAIAAGLRRPESGAQSVRGARDLGHEIEKLSVGHEHLREERLVSERARPQGQLGGPALAFAVAPEALLRLHLRELEADPVHLGAHTWIARR